MSMNLLSKMLVRATAVLLAAGPLWATAQDNPAAGQDQPAPKGEAAPASQLLPPVKVLAAGEPIDTGELIGYAGPTVLDHDGDGLLDLLVGSFMGKIQLFRNTGTREQPVFAAGAFLQAEGQDIQIHNW